MKFRVKDLEKYLIKKLDWEKIAEELTLKSFESTYNHGILEVDILPNRYPDASSIIGILKELKRIGVVKSFKEPESTFFTTTKPFSKIKVINQVNQDVPYYFGYIIFGLQNKESPLWLKEFVEFYDFNSINFLVDLANFVMIEYGAPLHIFDLDKIKDYIFVRLAKKEEKFVSLDNKEYLLEGGEIVITDKEKILALAGIKGGKAAEVDFNTKNIFIEAAVFSPEKIYQTSRKLNLKTDASFRFERKVAPIRSFLALKRLTSLIQEYLGGRGVYGPLNFKNLADKKIKFDFSKVGKTLGLKLDQREVIRILKILEIKKEENRLVIPKDRLDLNSQEDITEEIIRLYGWNKIKGKFEVSLAEVFVEEKIKFNYYLRNILTRLGYNEGYNYNFYGEREKEFIEDLVGTKLSHLQVLNPISENYKYFQLSLIPNLLKAVYVNQFSFKEIRLFTIEKIAFKNKDIQERYNLGVVFAFKDLAEILKELKSLLREISDDLKVNFTLKPKSNFLVEIFIVKELVGFLGFLSHKYLENFKLDLYVGFIELDLEKLINYKAVKKFTPWPIFPGISRDLSFFIDEKIRFPQIQNELRKLGINYLSKIELLDIYFPNDNHGKKSMTLRFQFSHPQRSLEEEEIISEVIKIEEFLRDRFKVEFR